MPSDYSYSAPRPTYTGLGVRPAMVREKSRDQKKLNITTKKQGYGDARPADLRTEKVRFQSALCRTCSKIEL